MDDQKQKDMKLGREDVGGSRRTWRGRGRGDKHDWVYDQIQKIKKNIFKLQKKHEDISKNIYK